MSVSSNNHTEVESRALYVQDQLRLNDQWQVLAGLRYDRFEVDTKNKLLNTQQASKATAPARASAWSGRRWNITRSMPHGARPSRPRAAA